jgi:hypothetical protein
LFSISVYKRPTEQELRSFGLMLGAVFSFIGLIPAVLRDSSPSPVLLLGIACTIASLFIPGAFRAVYLLGMIVGGVLGYINARILLSLLFYLVVTPMRILMWVVGKDPMNKKFNTTADTYRVARMPREASHSRHPF